MIALIDADSIPFTVCHNKNGEPIKTLQDCIQGANSFLNTVCNSIDADEAHLFWTLSKCFRYNVDPNYKVKRTGERPDFFFETRKYLIDNFRGLSHPDLEADDLLNIYKNKYIKEGKDYLIISKDKDVKNLVGSHYDPSSNVVNIIGEEYAAYYFWKSMIVGDPTDNIKGIPKKGKVYADNLLFGFVTEPEKYPILILDEYIKYFGEEVGIIEYYRNYRCLKILDSYEGIEFLEPIKSKDIYAKTLGVVGE